MKNIILIFSLVTSTFVVSSYAYADKGVSFGSMRKAEVNVRSGPGTQYPILWIFHRRDYPIEILEKYQSWYKVKDIEGEQGWVYKSLISNKNTSLVTSGEPIVMYKTSKNERAKYRLETGVVVSIDKCSTLQCKVAYRGEKGWVNRNRLTHIGK